MGPFRSLACVLLFHSRGRPIVLVIAFTARRASTA